MKKRDKICIIIIIVMVIGITGYFMYNIADILKYREGRPEDIVYTSYATNSSSYKVYLADNDYMTSDDIINDISFTTSLIEYIYLNFNYDYTGNEKNSVDYQYQITATITSSYNDTSTTSVLNPVWQKTFILKDIQTGTDKSFNINENLNIDLDYYNNLVSSFRQNLNMPIASSLDIKMNVVINGTLDDGQTFSKNHYIDFTIPLGVKAFDITTNKSFDDKEVIYSKTQETVENVYLIAIGYICLMLVMIWIGIYLIKMIINRNKSKITIQVEKILNEYNDRIITVSNFIDIKDLKIINIANFEELLNLSDETLEPIIYWDNEIKKEFWFSVIRNKVLYRYVVSSKNKI